MANTMEWPAGVLCITLPCLAEAYAIKRPTTYQSLVTTATSLFRDQFDEATEEVFIKTNDFGLEWPVEVLPGVWEVPEVHRFLKSVEIHTRMRGEGPSLLDFVDGDRTQATIPFSPSATPPRDAPGRAFAHSTPANRRGNVNRSADDEPEAAGYRGHFDDEAQEGVDQAEPGGSRGVRSRMSLQARGSMGNPRPIRVIRAEPTNEEILPPSSQESDVTVDARLHVEVQYEGQTVTVKVPSRKTLATLFKAAYNHFGLDKDTIKLFQMVSFDGRDSMSPIECNLAATLEEGNVSQNDIFSLLPYDGDD